MGSTSSKQAVVRSPIPVRTNNLTRKNCNEEEMFSRRQKQGTEISVDKLKKEMEEVVLRMKRDAANKDNEIERLKSEADKATLRYENLKSEIMDKRKYSESVHEDVDDKTKIKKLTNKIRELEAVLMTTQNEVEILRATLQQLRRDKDAEVSNVMHSVEKVITEKDNNIRRLRALYDTNDNSYLDHKLDVQNPVKTKFVSKATRYGISAENVEKESVTIIEGSAKSKDEIDLIERAFRDNAFLKNLSQEQMRKLTTCMSKHNVKQGENVIYEGTHGTHLYVIQSGKVEVVQSQGGENFVVAVLEEGCVFGELAILYNCRRTASIIARSDVKLWSLERTAFQNAVKEGGEKRRGEYIRMLKSVKNFEKLSENKLMRIADCLEQESFKADEYIIRQGESGDTFYIICEGKVKVTQNVVDNSSNKNNSEVKETLLSYLSNGEFFGEMALLREDKRVANVIAHSDVVVCLTLDRQAFSSLIGSLAEITRSDKNDKTEAVLQNDYTQEKSPSLDSLKLSETSNVRRILEKIEMSELKVKKVLGRGGFGCVKLVAFEGVDRPLALKTIKKSMIEKTGQQQHVIAEKNILLAARSPFIVRLYKTFKDKFNIHMLMDAYLGGEVYRLLKIRKHLGETSAKFCTGCVVEALAYLHIRGIAYRDLKPENLMIDHKGYIKLVDFGFAKRVRYGFKTWTFCGTPEYFPPEILQNIGHDFSADYWSLGVLIYELLSGTTPFYAQDDMAVYQKIVDGIDGVKFLPIIGKNAESLVRALCKSEPRQRLGYQKGAVNDIRKHRWFRGFNWQGLRQLVVKSPIHVDIKGIEDVRQFDHVPQNLAEEEDEEVIDTSKWDKDF